MSTQMIQAQRITSFETLRAEFGTDMAHKLTVAQARREYIDAIRESFRWHATGPAIIYRAALLEQAWHECGQDFAAFADGGYALRIANTMAEARNTALTITAREVN